MNATVAAQMTGADFLKLRKKRGTVIWAMVLAILPVIILFAVKAGQHSANPAEHGPAGGVEGLKDGLRLLALLMGPLAAVLIQFLLIVCINAPLHRWAPRYALRSGELAVILLMVLVACSIPNWVGSCSLIPRTN